MMFNTQGTPFGQQQPQWDLLTAEELEKYNRQVREERSKITYPQNPSLFPQSLRVQQRKQQLQKASEKAATLTGAGAGRGAGTQRQPVSKSQGKIPKIGNAGRGDAFDDSGHPGVGAEHRLAAEGTPGTKTQTTFKPESENLVLPKATKAGRYGRSLNLQSHQVFQGQRNSAAARTTTDGIRKEPGRPGDIHATSMTSKQSPPEKDPFKKLNSMEDYCKKQNIFFNENDRIKYQIKKSKGLYQEFRGSLQRGFKHLRHQEDGL